MKAVVGSLLSPVLLGIWVSWLPQALQPASTRRDLAVVAHPNVPVPSLTMSEVRELFRGDRQYWTPDLPVVILIPAPGSREYAVVLRSVYQMSESQYRRHWIARIFRAEAVAPPKTVQTGEVATELIGSLPGAITLVEVSRVRAGLRILPVDGRRPGEAGYPIR